MAKGRTQKSFKNAFINIATQIAILVFSFCTRTYFIKLLGAEYLGINGLFGNILHLLNLAEFGFGSAIIYNLYKCLANDDKKKINAYIGYYGYIYRIIALIIFVFGIALIPFLKYIVNLERDIPLINLYYFLFLLKSVFSYLFVYKSCIFQADQKSYAVNLNSSVWQILTNIFQLVFLYFTHNYLIYLLIQLACTLCSNFVIYRLAEIKYPFIKKCTEQLEKAEKAQIIVNVKALFMGKIGSVVVNHTDNILISVFVNTAVVGLYSNYTMILNIFTTLTQMLFGGLRASIGSFVHTHTEEESCDCFFMIFFVSFWLFALTSCTLFCILDDFIRLWIGTEFILGYWTLLIICLNLFMEKLTTPVWSFNYAVGLFRQTKYVTLITAALNLIISVILGKTMGLVGVLLGTVLARVILSVWYHGYVLFKEFFKMRMKEYYLVYAFYYLVEFALLFVIWYVKRFYTVHNLFEWILEFAVCVVSINLIFIVCFRKNKNFISMAEHIKIVFRKKKKA